MNRISPGMKAFRADVVRGMSESQKTIPSRWLYDQEGSRLFEEITRLPEYYPTRTELAILEENASEIAGVLGPGVVLVEYGAGALVKVRILLDALAEPSAFVPIDISAEHLSAAADELAVDHPDLRIVPVAADFMSADLGPVLQEVEGPRVGFFPGSTIGNLSDSDIHRFLLAVRRQLGEDAQLVLGVDQPKDPAILVPAYADKDGVTAAFNLNLLSRINRELGGTFDLSLFRHCAVWNEEQSRIEMHLECLQECSVRIAGDEYQIAAGETIHTENSRKIPMERIEEFADQAGWQLESTWSDASDWFSLCLLSATA